jgi:predicted  nucleic acid-binding Zn-ribbon protein
LIKEVSQNIVNRIENIFEQMNDERRKLNDFLDDIKPWKEFIPRQWFNLIEQKLSDFNVEELTLKRQLSNLLVEIRSGTAEESKMVELIDNFNQHPCSPISIERFFDENERIKTKIKTLTRLSPDKKELLTNIKSIEDFIQDFYDDDVHLLHICEQWEQEDEENSLKQMRFFINLKKKEQDAKKVQDAKNEQNATNEQDAKNEQNATNEQDAKNEKAKYWVIDYDLHSRLKNKPTKSVIYYATRASIESRDFYKDSLSKFIIIQIKLYFIK